MAKRYIGDATIEITYTDGRRPEYVGVIRAKGFFWKFEKLHPPQCGFNFGYDSPEAYDKMAVSAVDFGGYYSTHNRPKAGSKEDKELIEDGYPDGETASAIDEAASQASAEDGRGGFMVRRSKNGPERLVR